MPALIPYLGALELNRINYAAVSLSKQETLATLQLYLLISGTNSLEIKILQLS